MGIVRTGGGIFKRMIMALAVMLAASGAASAEYFGAIAYSPTSGVYGFSYDHGSRRDAEARAISECRMRGRGCKIAIWFKNACGSVAVGSNGWGLHGQAPAGTQSVQPIAIVRDTRAGAGRSPGPAHRNDNDAESGRLSRKPPRDGHSRVTPGDAS